MILRMNYNYSGLLGFWTLSIVQYSTQHNILETGSVSVLRQRGGGHIGSIERANLNH
jgi:hypothetical protein